MKLKWKILVEGNWLQPAIGLPAAVQEHVIMTSESPNRKPELKWLPQTYDFPVRVNLLPILFLAIAYFFLVTRYPVWNFDDLYLLKFKNLEWTQLKDVFLALDLPNEYRTYSFSRCLQVVLLKIFGDNPFPFYAIMAVTHLASGILIYSLVKRLKHSGIHAAFEGFGCAIIWVFSPFSICRTFHHYAYILLPFLFLVAYIYSFENGLIDSKVARRKPIAWVLLVLLCLSGEAILPAFFVYLTINILKKRDPWSAGLHIISTIAIIAWHYSILNSYNHYSSRDARFSMMIGDPGTLVSNILYFSNSVKSALAQGLQLTTIGYEPYFPLFKSYSFAWKHSSYQFYLSTLVFLIVGFAAILPVDSLFKIVRQDKPEWTTWISRLFRRDVALSRVGSNELLFVLALILSLWSLYFGMCLSGAKLYGMPFAIQVRYGYVILPTALIFTFMLWRHLANIIGIRGLRIISWAIPCIVRISWLAHEINVAPLNSKQDQEIISLLNEASHSAIRVVSLEHNSYNQDDEFFAKYRTFGITNPFIRWGDSPFQQDWTTGIYLGSSKLKLETRPYFDWDSKRVMFFQNGSCPTLVPKNQFMLIGSKSDGVKLTKFPTDDIYSITFHAGNNVNENHVEFLQEPSWFENGAELIRVTNAAKKGLNPRLVFVWNNVKSDDSVFVHLLDKNGDVIGLVDYRFEDSTEVSEGDEISKTRLYMLNLPRKIWQNVSAIGVGFYASSNAPQTCRKILNGNSDWGGYRLLLRNMERQENP